MIANGIRVQVKPKSRAHKVVRNLTGTVVGSVGYGEHAVQFDEDIGFRSRPYYGFNIYTMRNERLQNVRFVSERSLDIITVDVGDLEDDL